MDKLKRVIWFDNTEKEPCISSDTSRKFEKFLTKIFGTYTGAGGTGFQMTRKGCEALLKIMDDMKTDRVWGETMSYDFKNITVETVELAFENKNAFIILDVEAKESVTE